MSDAISVQKVFEAADEFPLSSAEAGVYKAETYNMWVYDPAAAIGLNIWFSASNRSFPNFMSTIIVYDQGKVWKGQSDGAGNPLSGVGGGNAFLSIIEPYKRFRVDYLGLLATAEDAAELRLSAMDLQVSMISPPIEQGSQGDRGEVASSGIIPRTAIRYEQLCRVTGPVRLGERIVQLDAFGVRSHRRNSASIYESGAVGHTWATALFPSGRGFHVLSRRVQPDAKVGFLYGHYFDGTRYHEAEVSRFPFYSGQNNPEVSYVELRVAGKALKAEIQSYPPLAGLIPPHDVRLTRSPARFAMDGEIGGGVLERSLMTKFEAGGDYLA